jgi:hypothetical protein
MEILGNQSEGRNRKELSIRLSSCVLHTFSDDLYLSLPLLSPWGQHSTWRVRTEAEAAALMMRSSHGQLVVDSLRSLRSASSGTTAVAEGAAGAGSGSRISYIQRKKKLQST